MPQLARTAQEKYALSEIVNNVQRLQIDAGRRMSICPWSGRKMGFP
jgi:hypothetical protein